VKSASSLERSRDELLARIVHRLEADERTPAAWLRGSFGRGEEDAYSDLDLSVVVDITKASGLCNTKRDGGRSRLNFVSAFGEPVIVHEHHANAPGDGAFTAIIYASGIAVDWTFLPIAQARRPSASRLLFDFAGIPTSIGNQEIDANDVADRLSERLAFFWLVAFPAAKAIRRGDDVRFHAVLELMHQALRDIDGLLAGQQRGYSRHSLAPFCPTPEDQRVALRAACEAVIRRSSMIAAAGGDVPDRQHEALELWIEL
jgi:hypothetical protein